jgi:hypothetical protein
VAGPYANRLSDAAFVFLLGLIGLAVAFIRVRDDLAVGYTLLVLAWAGLVISVIGNSTVGVGGGLAGAALSAAAGLLLLFDFHGATSGIARSNTAVNFILKPAWLRPSRATGMAWLVGAVIDVVSTIAK